jgi:hypothetical protein
VVLGAEHHWTCPNCPYEHTTRHAGPHIPFHPCPGLRGLTAPMVPAGGDCKVEAVERGDYVAGELVQTDDRGRPVAAIVTTRGDGSNDTVVLAPTARAERG